MRPFLVVNPRADRGFADLANRLLDAGQDTPEALESALRSTHVFARVRRRLLSAEPFVTWYVYRDGVWIGDGPRREQVSVR